MLDSMSISFRFYCNTYTQHKRSPIVRVGLLFCTAASCSQLHPFVSSSMEQTATVTLSGQDLCGKITLELQEDKIEEGYKYYIQFTAFRYGASKRKLNCSKEVMSELHTGRKVSVMHALTRHTQRHFPLLYPAFTG